MKLCILKNIKLMIRIFTIKHDYLKIIPRVRVGYELAVTYLEWIIILLDFIKS